MAGGDRDEGELRRRRRLLGHDDEAKASTPGQRLLPAISPNWRAGVRRLRRSVARDGEVVAIAGAAPARQGVAHHLQPTIGNGCG